MKVSLKWLKDYVDVNIPVDDLAYKLTMAGLEVDEVETIGAGWENILVGEVLGLDKHPNADKLQLATVDLGQEQWTVICGAPNIAPGQKIAYAKVGARLYDGHTGELMKLKPAKIRGVRSEGMVCSEKELGISENHEGILVLPGDAPTGKPLADYMGDTVLNVSVTPNRPDCLSMIGIAREVAALTGSDLHLPEAQYREQDVSTEDMISIEIVDPDLCPRYSAGIIQDVKIAPSPQWMQERLLAAGQRPISNIVDVTNFVMLEYGQPLHAFDYEGVKERKIIVRRARDDEKLVTLDGQDRQLNRDTLVIADEEYPVALAGVMGGTESEITERTTTILLESANFNNVNIRRTSFRLGLASEASSRFDKGISPNLTIPALQRALDLMARFGGGKIARGIVDAYPGRPAQKEPVLLSAQRAKQVLGVDFGIERIKEALESLGFTCEHTSDSELSVWPPYWRTDIRLADDLVEEVARIIGYDQIPTTMLSAEVPHHEPTPLRFLREQIQDILSGCGMQEVINYSLTSRDILEKTRYQGESGEPLRVANPLSREQELLRIDLRGGLLKVFANAERHQDHGVMLFEVGKVYLPREGDLPYERETLGGILGGPRFGRSWLGEEGALDFYYAKGILDTLFERLGAEARFEPSDDPILLPGRTASISVNGENVGVIGELHPDIAAEFDISSEPVCFFELDVDKLLPFAERTKGFQALPRFPTNDRDLALLVATDVPAQRILDIIYGYSQVKSATVFDVYTGEQVPKGKKSLAFSIRYYSPEHTLTDEEVDKMQERILAEIKKEVGAEIRQ
ncbi:MAG: phenylalanine--tRNA ligase subunit beta [Dehalococcoidia bacterium]